MQWTLPYRIKIFEFKSEFLFWAVFIARGWTLRLLTLPRLQAVLYVDDSIVMKMASTTLS